MPRNRGILCPVAPKITGFNSGTLAVTVFLPGSFPKVRVTAARPVSSVVAVVADSVPPPAVTAKVTVAPTNGFPFWSRTETTSGSANVESGNPCWLSPATLVRARGWGRTRCTSHTRTVPARDPVAKRLPSDEKST